MKNWSLNKKIWSVVGLLAFSFVVSSSFTIFEMRHNKELLQEITQVLVKRYQLATDMRFHRRSLQATALELCLATDEGQNKKLLEEFTMHTSEFQKKFDEFKAISDAEGKDLADKYYADYVPYLQAMKKGATLGSANKNKEGAEAIFGAAELGSKLSVIMDKMNELTANKLKEAGEKSNSATESAIWISIMLAATSIFASLLISFFVLRALGSAIGNIVKGLADSSTQVTSAATEIASSSEQLSQATTEQAASLEETAASVEEMNSMVAKNSENAKSAAESSASSQKKSLEGKSAIEKMSQSMEAINQSNNAIMVQVNRSNESMAGIVKVIEQIDKKTKIINEIVNKTELLSFNASVEAARAGEHGKGFAVVAEEVGNLARMSGAAAEEIAALLEESISKVNQIVHETKSGVEKLISQGKETVEGGLEVSRQCGEVFEEVVQNVNSVSGMANEISSASEEQARGINEITKAMSQLDQMTQQNAATSEQCASAAEQLSAQAESLKNSVTQLVFTVNGRDGNQPVVESQAMPIAQAQRRSSKRSASANVVHLKSPKGRVSQREPQLKKASGSAPDYDSDGFNDV